MTKIDKLVTRFHSIPKDLTWMELLRVLRYYGFHEVKQKGKTGGSRCRFINADKKTIRFHIPHGKQVIKQYVIRNIIEDLDLG